MFTLQDARHARTVLQGGDVTETLSFWLGLCSTREEMELPKIAHLGRSRVLVLSGLQTDSRGFRVLPRFQDQTADPMRLSEEIEPRPGVQPMKSKGSTGHPENCKVGIVYMV